MAKHRVRLHQWNNGRLQITDSWFDSFEEAISFSSNSQQAHNIKVFNEDGAVVHSGKPVQTDTYA
jgi:hypothetical protein